MNLSLKIGSFEMNLGKKSFGTAFDLPGVDGPKISLQTPMKNSVWVMRAIKHVSGPIASVPLQFQTKAGGRLTQLNDAELDDFWENPFENVSAEDGVEALVGWLKLKGECFLLLDDSWLAHGAKSRLIIARPDSMREIARSGVLLGWTFSDDGRSFTLLPEQVAQAKFWNPYNKWRGLSEYAAASIAAESDYAAGAFAKSLAENNGDRGPYIVAKGGMPDDEQRKMIIQQLRDKKQLALNGNYRPVFLAGDLDVKDPLVQAVDAAFIAQRLENRHEIFIAFGVPASMADVTASYSAGTASDRYRLIEETCIPTARKLTAMVELVSNRLKGATNIKARFNFDEHSVMQQVRAERIDGAAKLWQCGVPLKVAGDYLGMGLPEYPGSLTSYLPFSVAPVGGQADADDPDFKEDPDGQEEEAAGDLQKIFARYQPASPAPAKNPARRVCSCALALDAKAAPLWKQHAAARLKVAKMYQSKFARVLFDARKEMLAKLELLADLGGKSVITRAGLASTLMFDLVKFSGGFSAVMKQAGQNAFDTAGGEAWKEFGKEDPWKSPPQAVRDFLADRENRLAAVPQEIFDEIKGAVQDSIDAGDSIEKMAQAIRDAFNDCDAARARMIAMTETSAAYGEARQASMKQAGIQYKQWLTSGNDNVRAAHREAEGQTVPVDDPFIVDGEQLMNPGDSNGSPGNVINCHCIAIAVEKPDEDENEEQP
jgi:SPP1 gp7 family putative phage head morphogenesis protein